MNRQPELLSASGHSRRMSKQTFFKRYGYAPGMDRTERKQIFQNIARQPFITTGFEVSRLRIKLVELNDNMMLTLGDDRARWQTLRDECAKAIASLALLAK